MPRPSLLFALLLPALVAAQVPPVAPNAGGTRLVYDLPAYEVGRLLDKRPGSSLEVLMTDVLSQLRAQLGSKAEVMALGGTQFAVDVRGDAAVVAAIRPRIEIPALEMRVVATADFALNGVTFDLKKEKGRLEAWLAGGGRELVLADPRAIARFNADPKNGPLAFEHLRWVPHVVRSRLDDAKNWEMPYSNMPAIDGVPPLADSTVAVFDAKGDFNDGRVPEARRKEPRPFLLEFVAINWMEVWFGGTDLDPAGIVVARSPEGLPGLAYKLRDAKAAAYAEWSGKYIRHHTAMMVDGAIVSAPYFVSRIPGNGMISGSFTPAELEALAARLRGGSLPLAPVLLRTGPIPK